MPPLSLFHSSFIRASSFVSALRYARSIIQSFRLQPLSYGPSTLSHWVRCSSILPSWCGRTSYLSPALNDRSLGDRLIAIRYYDTRNNAHTPAICILSAGTKNRSWTRRLLKMGVFPDFHTTHTARIHDIVDLAAKHRNAIHEYEPVPQGMKDEWMVGQDDELLFWVPLERRKVLGLPHVEAIGDRPPKMDFSRFRYGSKWIECIEQVWLKELEEREKGMVGRLE